MNDQEVSAVTKAIKLGARKILPPKLLSRKYVGIDPLTAKEVFAETQILDDVIQTAWIKLLEGKDLSGRAANIAGRNAARNWLRLELKTIPISQLNLKQADPDDEDSENIMPWDTVDINRPSQFESGVYRLLNEIDDDIRQEAVLALNKDDQRFLARYLSKKVKHTAQQRKRFQRLRAKLNSTVVDSMSHSH